MGNPSITCLSNLSERQNIWDKVWKDLFVVLDGEVWDAEWYQV